MQDSVNRQSHRPAAVHHERDISQVGPHRAPPLLLLQTVRFPLNGNPLQDSQCAADISQTPVGHVRLPRERSADLPVLQRITLTRGRGGGSRARIPLPPRARTRHDFSKTALMSGFSGNSGAVQCADGGHHLADSLIQRLSTAV